MTLESDCLIMVRMVGELCPPAIFVRRAMSEPRLCDDHLNGWTPRYSGRQPPRFGCPECWKIYQGAVPAPAAIEDLKGFSRLTDGAKRRVLLGEERFRIAFWDLECTHLKPNVGRILCASFKPLGEDPYTFDALTRGFKKADVYDDSALAVAIRDELEKFDIIVGHNSKLFDTKFLNSRLIRVGERTKPAQYQVDTMWSWRSKFSAWSGLDNVQQFALEDAEVTKTKVAWPQWMRALGWNLDLARTAMDEIVDHCERDVIVLEEAYRLMAGANVIRSLRRDGGVL